MDTKSHPAQKNDNISMFNDNLRDTLPARK